MFNRRKEKTNLMLVTPDRLEGDDTPLELIASRHAVDRSGRFVPLADRVVHVVFALLIVFFGWAAFTTVDVVAEAPGSFIPLGDLQNISPSADGIVDQIFVKDGQTVKAGDSLVSLDREPFEAQLNIKNRDVEIAQKQLSQCKLSADALEAAVNSPDKINKNGVVDGAAGELVDNVYKTYAAWKEAKSDAIDDKTTKPSAIPSDSTALMNQLNDLQSQKHEEEIALTNRQKEYAAQTEMIKIKMQDLKEQMTACQETTKRIEVILARSREQEKAYANLAAQGAMSQMDYLNVQKQVQRDDIQRIDQNKQIETLNNDIDSANKELLAADVKAHADLAQQQANISKLAEQIAQVEISLRGRARSKTLAEIDYQAALNRARAALAEGGIETAKAQTKLEQAHLELKDAQHNLDLSVIKSPLDGVVTGIRITGKGQVVSHKEHLMTVIPTSKQLVVEAFLKNKDAGFVHKGQSAKLKMAAFPFQDYGMIRAVVFLVEENAERDEENSPSAGAKEVEGVKTTDSGKVSPDDHTYRVLLQPERTWVQEGGHRIDFTSGMEVSAEIITRKRTILSIFFEPLRKLKDAKWE